jgi:hypothetical protein
MLIFDLSPFSWIARKELKNVPCLAKVFDVDLKLLSLKHKYTEANYFRL